MKRLLLVLAVLVCAVPAFAGLTYDFKSVTSGRGGTTLAGTAAVEGKNMRLEFSSGDQMIIKNNSVMISKDGGRNFLVLDPQNKTYYEFSFEELLKAAGNVLKAMGGMVQMNVSNQIVNTTEAGAGEKIEGYDTQKMVVNSSYDMSMKIMGMNTKSHVESTTEVWYTTSIPVEYMTFVQQKNLKTGFEELDKLIETQTAKTKGFPLRQIVTSKSTSGKRSETTVTTTNISNLKSGNVAAAKFEVPAGYQKEEQPALGIPGMPKMQ